MNIQPRDRDIAASTLLPEVDADAGDRRTAHRTTSVYVYEAPVRVWHWVNALAILVLCVTGYLIGAPPPSVGGEASDSFLFGYVRFAHFAAGWVLAIFFLGRIYWAFAGNVHARQLFYVPVWSRRWWQEVWFELKWYLFMEREPKKYVGHNPLAQLMMFLFITCGLTFMIMTGFALYAEGLGAGSWADAMFGWLIPLVGGSMALHTLHHIGMWFIIIFTMLHIYTAVREDIMSRQSMISTIVSGERTFKDDDPD